MQPTSQDQATTVRDIDLDSRLASDRAPCDPFLPPLDAGNAGDASIWNDSQHSENAFLTAQPPRTGADQPHYTGETANATIRNDSQPLENEFCVPFADQLSERQRTAIELLLSGEREGKVAEKIGVARTTIWRWRQSPQFRLALDAARELAFGAAIDRLRGLVPDAVDVLQENVKRGSETTAVRVLRLARVDRGPQRR